MPLLETMRTQDATYWAPGASDGMGGTAFAAPTALSAAAGTGVRWEDKAEMFLTPEGKEEVSSSVVYLGQDVVVRGYLFEGTSVEADPRNVSGAREIRQFQRIPKLRAADLTGLDVLRQAFLTEVAR